MLPNLFFPTLESRYYRLQDENNFDINHFIFIYSSLLLVDHSIFNLLRLSHTLDSDLLLFHTRSTLIINSIINCIKSVGFLILFMCILR